jgi:predicted RNA binding protein with dsRBD fold (UPF0201 family)
MNVTVICEIKYNPTEDRTGLKEILQKLVEGEIKEDTRFDGNYLYLTQTGLDAIQKIRDWIRDSNMIDTFRQRLFRYQQSTLTSLYLNRQALVMDKLALLDLDDNPPLGPILIQIIADNENDLNEIIDEIAPRTFDSRIVSKEEFDQLMREKQIEKEKSADKKSKIKR